MYDYAFEVSSVTGQLTCDGEGVVTMSQVSVEFSGTYDGWLRCAQRGGGFIYEGTGLVSVGSVDGQSVSFRLAVEFVNCVVTGDVLGEPVTSLAGYGRLHLHFSF